MSARDVISTVRKIFGVESGSVLIGELDRLYPLLPTGRIPARDEIIHQTEQVFRKRHTVLRSVLALFIIIGLLGTLAGLAVSLDALRVEDVNLLGNSAWIRESMTEVLSKLSSAFAPSVLGVFATIVGVLFYSWYLSRSYSVFSDRMGLLVSRTILPSLFPQPAESITRALERAFRDSANVIKAANQLSKEADRIETSAERLASGIHTAVGYVADFGDLVERVTKGTQQFKDVTEVLDRIALTVKSAQEQSGEAAVRIANASEAMDQHVTALKGLSAQYETSVGDSRDAIAKLTEAHSAAIAETLSAFRSASTEAQDAWDARGEALEQLAEESIKAQRAENERLATLVSEPVAEQLKTIDESLHSHLQTISTSIGSIKDSTGQVVASIDGANRAFLTSVETLVRDVIGKFEEQNATQRQLASLMEILTKATEALQKAAAVRPDRRKRWPFNLFR
jgi:hypothetical protein